MKAMKGKLLKKLKTIKTIGYLKQERVLHSYASDGYIHTSPPQNKSNPQFHTPLISIQVPEESQNTIQFSVHDQEPEIIDVSELMKDLDDDQEMELDDELDDKENVRPDVKAIKFESLKENVDNFSLLKPKIETLQVKESKVDGQEMELEGEMDDKENTRPDKKAIKFESLRENVENFSSLKPKNETFDGKLTPLGELDVSNFRRPDLDSGTLFDPNLLAAFEEAVSVVKAQEAERKAKIEEKIFKAIEVKEEEEEEEEEEDDDDENEPPLKTRKIEAILDPLLEFEEKCPPGGCDSVILYTTGLRGIRKTFEDCHSIRFLLENFRVLFYERDISMHCEFKEELWRILDGKIVPPRLFIKGRYIGGAEEVLTLHEQGKLRPLLEGIPVDNFQCPCEGCAGMRFIMCFKCNGSQKIVVEDESEAMKCLECNENGLIVCPYCC